MIVSIHVYGGQSHIQVTCTGYIHCMLITIKLYF